MLLFRTGRARRRQSQLPPAASQSPPLETDAVTRLRPLLAAAATLDLEDHAGCVRLRESARTTIAGLIADGALPEHLSVGPQDPPVLVTRTITAAWKRATLAPSRRTDGR